MSQSPKIPDKELRRILTGGRPPTPFRVETVGGECFSGVVLNFDPITDLVTFDDMSRRDGLTHTHSLQEIRRVDPINPVPPPQTIPPPKTKVSHRRNPPRRKPSPPSR